MRVIEAFERLAPLSSERREVEAARLGFDTPMLERLKAMFAADAAAGLLDVGMPADAEGEPDGGYASLSPGTIVGGFRVDRLIGRGGVGEVYLAHRDGADFEQRAALKMLRPEAAGRFSAFGAERRMLASLDHPAIARLIDGGVSPDGRPFILMDYVEGVEINRWCADRAADLETRLRLFLDLCDAVGHAHARLVIHRDIKPANILVDAEGRGRLLDFGIGRLLDSGDRTRPATDVMLTPQYAAPEQIEGGDITVAADIYSLGAVLYELLAGRGPWEFGGDAKLPTVLRRMLYDEPPPPSEIAAKVTQGARIPSDLDAIVMKAMRREPEQRYSSVEALAADVRRYRAFQPVEAHSGAHGYRIRRFVRRNRMLVLAGGLVAASLLAGTGGIAWQAQRASAERDAAMAQAERAEAVNQAMMLMFRDASDRGEADSITARALIDGTATRLAESLDPDDEKSAAIIAALSDLYILTENIPASQALLESALTRGIGRHDPAGMSRLRLKLAQAYGATRRFGEARRLLKEAEAVWATAPDRYRVERVEASSAEAYMLRLEGKTDQGIALLMETMPAAEQAFADNGRDLATRYANLATHLVMANRLEEADKIIERSKALLSRAGAMQSPAGLTLEKLRGSILARRGDTAKAEDIFRAVTSTRRDLYGPSYSLAVDQLQHGRLLNQLERPAEALGVLDDARSMAAANFGRRGSLILLIDLARVEAMLKLNRLMEADDLLAALGPQVKQYGPRSVENGVFLVALAQLEARKGRARQAGAALAEAESVFSSLGSAGAGYLQNLAGLRRLSRY